MKDTVLIVDDMELNREMLREILEEDYEIAMAGDGLEAVGRLEDMHNDIAVVLLDLQMPGMDGFEVLKEMESRGWIEKIPVLIITGEKSTEVENQ